MPKDTHIIEVKTKGAIKSEKEIKGVGNALGGMAKKAGVAAAAYFGSQALLQGIRSSIDLFAKQELAEKKLRFAAGKSTEELIKQAKSLQQVTSFGDEAIIAQQAYVKSLGVSTEQTKEIIAASVDLASAMGISLESAVMNTTKTLSGMQGELGEKLPAAFKLLSAEQLKAGEGIKFIREQFKGTAEVEAQTLSGSLEQMSNAIGDAGEVIGELLAPTVIAAANGITALAEGFQSLMNWQDKYKALALETRGIVSEQDAAFINMKNSIADNTDRLDILANMQTTINMINQSANMTYGENLDLINQMTNAELESTIAKGELKELSEFLLANDIEHSEVLAQLLEKYLALPENVQVTTDAYALYEQQQLKTLEMQKQELENQEQFIKNYPEQAKALGLVSKAEKEDQKEKEKRVKIVQKLGSVSKAVASAEKTFAVKSTLQDTYASAQVQFKKFSQAYPAPLGQILGTAAAGAAISAGLANVASIKQAQYGADFVTSGPELLMVGEGSGPERVQVTPLVDENIDGPQGGGMTINVQGSVIGTEEFVESVLLDQIKEGLRLGGDIGI